MKIALVNYRYFISGGPERYYFNIKKLLEEHGHEVFPFSIKNSLNINSEFESYFMDSNDDEVYFEKTKKSLKKTIKSITRIFYSREAKKKIDVFLDEFNPDVLYIMQWHNKISPSIIWSANKRKIPVIHRISDFQYLCPNALFYNKHSGICEDCLDGKYYSCIKYQCVHDSKVFSSIKLLAMLFHNAIGVKDRINGFIFPSSFTMEKFISNGFQASKLHHIPTFYSGPMGGGHVGDYFLYFGRIEYQKGLLTLIKTFIGLPYKLKIIGFSNDGFEDELKNIVHESNCKNIEFLGKMDFPGISEYISNCFCSIAPSEWYDNFPNTVLESFAHKKCVIASNAGSLKELVIDKKSGLLFKSGSVVDLTKKVEFAINNPDVISEMGIEAYKLVENEYSAERHYERIITLFNQIIIDNQRR